MRIPRIYTELLLIEGQELRLDEAASHHLIKVLRMPVGRELVLFNGQGGEYRASIVALDKKSAVVEIGSFNSVNKESPLHSHLAVGLSRGERFDLVLQKATELGVSEITPLFTERTEVKLSAERLNKKALSWQKIIVSACEQSGRCILPKLNSALKISEFLNAEHEGEKFVLHHRNSATLQQSKLVSKVAFLIGPEGGLSEAEIEAANQSNFQNLALGPRVLRTETAPLAALALMQHHWGDI